MKARLIFYPLLMFSLSFFVVAAAIHPPSPPLVCSPPAYAGGRLLTLAELLEIDYGAYRDN